MMWWCCCCPQAGLVHRAAAGSLVVVTALFSARAGMQALLHYLLKDHGDVWHAHKARAAIGHTDLGLAPSLQVE